MGTAERMTREEGRTAYRGDIYALEEDRGELAAMGVELGCFNARWRCFENCVVRHEVLEHLRAMGNKYLWELVPVSNGDCQATEPREDRASGRRDAAGAQAPAWLSAGSAPRGSTQ